MARDYKHRAHSQKRKSSVVWWKWLLVVTLIGSFAYFLISIRANNPDKTNALNARPSSSASKKAPVKQAEKEQADEPKFTFYTFLPDKEVVVSDYEIQTRKREENVGKAKVAQYVMQAGSFRNYADADRLKARLAMMGIESKIERAKVGEIIWNRIKIGPFTQVSSVDRIRAKLRQNNIDVVVTEIGG